MSGILHHVATARQGLALEARLFGSTEQGVCVWTAKSQAIVCPASYRRLDGFADLGTSGAAPGWPVATRPTGGGAVPQGPGVLNLALALTVPRGFSIEDGYTILTGILSDALSEFADDLGPGPTPNSFCDGTWNLTIGGRKVAGTAQRWRPLSGGRNRVLAHALVLVDVDIDDAVQAVTMLNKHLGLPPVRPEMHVTLREHRGSGLEEETLAAGLFHAAIARLEAQDQHSDAA
ncbi:MAG: hypothetical protein AAGH83_10770 [Pseudomonadota bacterium]